MLGSIRRLGRERGALARVNEELRGKYGELEMKALEDKGVEGIRGENAKLAEEIGRLRAENEKEEEKYLEIEKEYEEFQRKTESNMNKISDDYQRKLNAVESQLAITENDTIKLEKTLNSLKKKLLEKPSTSLDSEQNKSSTVDSRELLCEKTKEVLEYEALQRTNEDLKGELEQLKKSHSDSKEGIIHLRNKLIGISQIKDQSHSLQLLLSKENSLLKLMLKRLKEPDINKDSLRNCNDIMERFEDNLHNTHSKLQELKQSQHDRDEQIRRIKSVMEDEVGSQQRTKENELTENDTDDVIQKYLLTSLKFI